MDLTKVTEQTWDELLGSNNWEGLLEPLDLGLRHLILRCGDFCQATYDAFNNDQCSKFCGSSRYGKQSFFEKVSLNSASSYQVLRSMWDMPGLADNGYRMMAFGGVVVVA